MTKKTMYTAHSGIKPPAAKLDNGFDEYVARMVHRVQRTPGPWFFTGIPTRSLFSTYLDTLSRWDRQYHDCHACESFINHYGHLVTINPNGSLSSLLWQDEDQPGYYSEAIKALRKTVEAWRIEGVFYTDAKVLGTAITGEWTHFYAKPHASVINTSPLQTAFQKAAEKNADYTNMSMALKRFTLDHIRAATHLLSTNSLYRSEKVLGMAEWLLEVAEAQKVSAPRAARHLLWKAVAEAPPGYCHPSSSMLGSLLDDIAMGMGTVEAKRRFDAKMNPLQYQRPQAAPKAGNVERAEVIVKKMGLEASLKRRYARLDEVETIWRPREAKKKEKSRVGVFSSVSPVQSKRAKSGLLDLPSPSTPITWEKFARTVLPWALEIHYPVPREAGEYVAITTAVDPDAPPILQWDIPENRNPFAWYVYYGGSYPIQWNLRAGSEVKVVAISFQPSMWGDNDLPHQGKSVFFLLEGCVEQRRDVPMCLFPEILKAELREARSTIEAYSNKNYLAKEEGPVACGVRLVANQSINPITLRVRTELGESRYKLDRWD